VLVYFVAKMKTRALIRSKSMTYVAYSATLKWKRIP